MFYCIFRNKILEIFPKQFCGTFGAAKSRKITVFSSKIWPFFKIFDAFGAGNYSLFGIAHPLFGGRSPPIRSLIKTFERLHSFQLSYFEKLDTDKKRLVQVYKICCDQECITVIFWGRSPLYWSVPSTRRGQRRAKLFDFFEIQKL